MRKNMKKATRATALALASVLCLGACGQPANSSTGESQQTSTSSVVETSTQQADAAKNYWEMLSEVSDTSELPDWEGDTLEITIWNASGTDAMTGAIPESDVVYKELERVTGVKINVEDSFGNGGNNIDAKLPMVIGTGNLPNIIMGYDIDKQLAELFENGYLADLSEYYENDTFEQLTDRVPLDVFGTYVYSQCKDEDGNYYLLPCNLEQNPLATIYLQTGFTPDIFNPEYYSTKANIPKTVTGKNGQHAFMVRDDILQALYPDALTYAEIQEKWVANGTFTEEEIYHVNIESREAFYDFLRDIKELVDTGDYVGLDGKPMEVTYGANSEADNWNLGVYWPSLMGTDWDYFGTVNKKAADESDVVKYTFKTDAFTQHLKDMNQLIREDIIAQNSFIDNAATELEKINNFHYAVTYVQDMPQKVEAAGFDIGYTPIWLNIPFDEQYGGVGTVKFSTYMGIFKDTLSDEELDQLVHAINYINSPVWAKCVYYGPASAGLFTEDADGKRTYVHEELTKCMVLGEDNGAAAKYGLAKAAKAITSDDLFNSVPAGVCFTFFEPSYLAKGDGERLPNNAKDQFNPGHLEGQSVNDVRIFVDQPVTLYSTAAKNVEGLASFWTVRNAWEGLLKKAFVAESDAEFEKCYNEAVKFAEDNGLTDETLKQYNDWFVEANRAKLKAAGIIK